MSEITPLLDELKAHTSDATDPVMDQKLDPVMDQKLDPEIEQGFNAIQLTLNRIIAHVATVGYIDIRYGDLKQDLASIDAGLATLKTGVENDRKSKKG